MLNPRQFPRTDSRDLQPGQKVRLAIGKEGETLESRVMRGLGQGGVAYGTVLHVNDTGVHLHGDDSRFEYMDHHDGGKIKTTGLGAGMRFLHDDIGQARVLHDED